jgi:hypothetical protein
MTTAVPLHGAMCALDLRFSRRYHHVSVEHDRRTEVFGINDVFCCTLYGRGGGAAAQQTHKGGYDFHVAAFTVFSGRKCGGAPRPGAPLRGAFLCSSP